MNIIGFADLRSAKREAATSSWGAWRSRTNSAGPEGPAMTRLRCEGQTADVAVATAIVTGPEGGGGRCHTPKDTTLKHVQLSRPIGGCAIARVHPVNSTRSPTESDVARAVELIASATIDLPKAEPNHVTSVDWAEQLTASPVEFYNTIGQQQTLRND